MNFRAYDDETPAQVKNATVNKALLETSTILSTDTVYRVFIW